MPSRKRAQQQDPLESPESAPKRPRPTSNRGSHHERADHRQSENIRSARPARIARAEQAESSPQPENISTSTSSTTNGPQIQYRALLVVDGGTENVKVVFATQKIINGVPQSVPLSDLIPIQWPNEQISVRAQMAYKQTVDPATGKLSTVTLFGYEVDDALAKDEIAEKDIIRHMKPMALFGALAQDRRTDASMQEMMSRLNLQPNLDEIKFFLRHVGDQEASEGGALEVDQYGQLLRWVLRQVLPKISKQYTELGWPTMKSAEQCDDFLRTNPPNLVIGLPVPAKCTDKENGRIVAAAKRAGISKPHLISEPAAALMHELQEKKEQRIDFCSKRFLLLDDGAGSADWTLCSAVEEKVAGGTSVIKLFREIPAETRWCGGATTDSTAADILISEIRATERGSLKTILSSVKQSRGRKLKTRLRSCEDSILHKQLQSLATDLENYGFNESMLRRELTLAFSDAKKSRPGVTERLMPFLGMPGKDGTLLCAGEVIRVTPSIMRKSFKPATKETIVTTTNCLKTMAEVMQWEGAKGLPIHEIIVSGGATTNAHFQDELTKEVQKWTAKNFPGARIPIKFIMRSDNPAGLAKAALGGLLFLANQNLMGQRRNRRECLMLDGPIDGRFDRLFLRESFFNHENEKQHGQFLTKDREILDKSECHHLGNLGLRMSSLTTNKNGVPGWASEIPIYTRYASGVDFANTKRQPPFTSKQLEPLEKILLPIFIPKVFVLDMPATAEKEGPVWDSMVKSRTETWYHVQYALRLRFRGTNVTIRVAIPKSGKFHQIDTADKLEFVFRQNWESAFYPAGSPGLLCECDSEED